MGTSIEIRGAAASDCAKVVSKEALDFIGRLDRKFEFMRSKLLVKRDERRLELESGTLPDFPAETASIREAEWKVAPIPTGLLDRKVEITGPVDRQTIVNALNSGACVFTADFEDADSPVSENCVRGQLNLRDAVRNSKTATLFVRPRGWHLVEKHAVIEGRPVSASLFDFGMFFFHNARTLVAKGAGPYFYLPKLENRWEARLWNDVFNFAQDDRGIPRGTIRATVSIETILAAFEMDEILYQLKEHSAGLACERWNMERPFLEACAELLVRTCHRRGIHAIGGTAEVPITNDPAANEAPLAKVRADKLCEVDAGFDGTRVAHPELVPIAKEVFDRIPGPHQISNARADVRVNAQDLLRAP